MMYLKISFLLEKFPLNYIYLNLIFLLYYTQYQYHMIESLDLKINQRK